jgi:spore germination protein KA
MLFTFAGAMLGFFGITSLLIFFTAYLSDFDSYGSAYFAPIAPFVEKDLKDAIYKNDITNNFTRPDSIANNKKNLHRQAKK